MPEKLSRLQLRVPSSTRSLLASVTRFMGEWAWEYVSDDGEETVLRRIGKISQRSCNWRARSPQETLANKFNKGMPVDRFVSGTIDPQMLLVDPVCWAETDDPLFAMLHCDYIGYLPYDILVKIDWASMAVGLESLPPLLNHRVFEFSSSMPRDYLFDGHNGKPVLRDLLTRYVPREFIGRPKRGFSVPVKEWLVGPLWDWIGALISEQTLCEQGTFDVDAVRQASGLAAVFEGLGQSLGTHVGDPMFQTWFLKLEY